MWRIFIAMLLAFCLPSLSFAENLIIERKNVPEFNVRGGETAEIAHPYYASRCVSQLVAIDSVELLGGPPGASLSYHSGWVRPNNPQCQEQIVGATVVVTAPRVNAKSSTLLTYRVRMKTMDGPKEFTRTVLLTIFP